MRVLAVLLVASGCGRLEFGALGDAGTATDALSDGPGTDVVLANHDEDGDGTDDALDTCPHLAGANTDGDGDGVGDACDPEPATPRQHWRRFFTMRAGDVPTQSMGTWTQQPDGLSFDGMGFANLTDVRAFAEGRVVVGLTVTGLNPSAGFHQIAFGSSDSLSQTSYFLEVQETVAPGYFQITYADASTFTPQSQQQLQTGIHAGDMTMQVTYVTTPSKTVLADAGWVGEPYGTSTAATMLQPSTDYTIGTNDCAITVTYMGLIESGP